MMFAGKMVVEAVLASAIMPTHAKFAEKKVAEGATAAMPPLALI